MGTVATGQRQGRVAATLCAALTCALPVTGPALAAGLFEPPAGCAVYLTTQNRSCSVQNYYRCPQIDPDHQWRASFDGDGPRFVSRIDGQAQWVTSGPFEDPTRVATLTPIRDSMHLDTLLADARDTFEFFQRQAGAPFEHYKGEDRLAGEAEIDAEPLFATTFWLEKRDWNGDMIRVETGTQYVSKTHRRFFGGLSTITFSDGEAVQFDDTPVEFIYPGEAGFAATRPLYDCGVMSRAPSHIIPTAYTTE